MLKKSKASRRMSLGLNRTRVAASLGCLLLAVSPTIGLAQSSESRHGEHRRTVTVSGTGEVQAAPDMATVTMGVETEAESPAAALEQNNDQMEKLLQQLRDLQIADRDLQTSTFQVIPRREQDDRGRGMSQIVGYRVINQVQVTVRNLDRLGEILSAGANRIEGVQFDIQETQDLMDSARKKAVEQARRKAEVLAQAAGVKLGPPQEISESDMGRPQPYAAQRALAETSAVPVTRGELTLTSQVHIVYQLQADPARVEAEGGDAAETPNGHEETIDSDAGRGSEVGKLH